MKTTTISLSEVGNAIRRSDQMDLEAVVPTLIGKKAVFTTHEGERLVGTIEGPLTGPNSTAYYPIIRFEDGRWARCDDAVELVD